MLGLPENVRACLFDLDGVLTQTAKVHAAAWKEMFDTYLAARAKREGGQFVAFDPVADYDAYIDGRLREDGTRSFLASRGITLPEGTPDDPPTVETIHGLSNRKNQLLLDKLEQDGVQVYPGSVRYLQAVRAANMPRAVVSASANTRQVLAAAHLDDAFETIVDGVVAGREHLKGKPAPDSYLAAARLLHIEPAEAAVFEDALAGVEAGHAGGFGFVVGVDRVGQREELRKHGADRVVDDLAELLDRA
ncbi:MAG: beta-phosphoglucomutase family hydrolase [Chloroflexi bacterium]|nr:beta-phosphoglucomutase family hydrolase [Chloroflexota bacterium]